jgi:hypothetical protein
MCLSTCLILNTAKAFPYSALVGVGGTIKSELLTERVFVMEYVIFPLNTKVLRLKRGNFKDRMIYCKDDLPFC